MQGLPEGFRFSPTEEELIVEFLQKKLRGEPLPYDVVFECDIYGDKEPWMIFDKTLKQNYHVFTKLKKKSQSRVERIAGCGTWKEDGSEPILDHENRCIGFKKSFHFYVKPSLRSEETNGRWIMHEYSIEKSDDYVLCEIRNKDLDKLRAEYDHRLRAVWEEILATQDVRQSDKSQRLSTRNLGFEEENQQQKKIKLSNNIVAQQQPMDTSVVSTDLIFDGLPDVNIPTTTNVEDIDMGDDYLDYSMLELNFDHQECLRSI